MQTSLFILLVYSIEEGMPRMNMFIQMNGRLPRPTVPIWNPAPRFPRKAPGTPMQFGANMTDRLAGARQGCSACGKQ